MKHQRLSSQQRRGSRKTRVRIVKPAVERLEDRTVPSLVAAYGFNEGSGSTLTDSSGNILNGTIAGAAWSAGGKYGGALNFDGVNDWVTINDNNLLDLSTGMTLEAWVNLDVGNGFRDVLIKEGSNVDIYNLYARNWRGLPEGNVFVNGSNHTAEGTSLPVSTWVHLAATYDGAVVRYYADGNLAASSNIAGSIPASTGPLRIGGNSLWGEFFDGLIDEVRIYNHVLTQTQIQADMNTPVGDNIPPMVSAVSPSNGATGVAVSANVTVTFSEPMNVASINASTFELRDRQNLVVPAAITYDAGTNTATLNPNVNLEAVADYLAVRVVGGSSGVKDAAGNPLATDFVWGFSTGTPVFQESQAFGGLTNPTVLRFAPDGRVFVAEKSGLIKVLDNLSDTTATVFADLRTEVHNYWDRGLLGMALHPDFANNPYVYVLYTRDAPIGGTAPAWGIPGGTSDPGPATSGNGPSVSGRLSRLTVGPGNTWDGNELVLVSDWGQQYPSHSIGSLVFGPDGALYASGGDGASFNFADYGQEDALLGSTRLNDPPDEGGALRSQDLRSPNDPTSLDGSIIRIDPDSGLALPTNPLYATGNDENARRIIAHGFRNPFRITVRPGTDELWIGDVGWSTWEEINWLPNPADGVVENFGWPAYEGPNRQGTYDSINLPLLESFYAEGPAAHAGPYYAYQHSQQVITGSGEPTGSSSISGLAFSVGGGNLPAAFDGALFFSDYSRDRIYVMFRGVNGLPDPASRKMFVSPAQNPVELIMGPDGSLFYVDFDGGAIRKVQYVASNQPPVAVIQADQTLGAAPLTVNFNGTASSDPDPGDTLSYAWDLDGDGQFDDSTSSTPSFTYTAAGLYLVGLRVTDNHGAFDTDTVAITVGTPPTAVIDSPAPSFTWKVGDVITFAGHATDAEEGTLPASALSWSWIMHHGTHTHPLQDIPGIAGGTFTAPDHEYPSHLELRLTATDATGLSDTVSVLLFPQIVDLTVQTDPAGLQVAIGSTSGPAPLTQTVIIGSQNTISTPSVQNLGGTNYQFTSWSDGGAASHDVIAPAVATTYTASFAATGLTGLVAAYGFNEGSGTTLTDFSGNGLNGIVSGATWSPSGKYGGALNFDGVNDWVTIADNSLLDLSTGMTLEAWVRLDVANGFRDVLIKEGNNVDIYNMYARNWRGLPEGNVFVNGSNVTAEGTALAANTWVYLTATYDGSVVRYYANGNLAASSNIAGSIPASTGPLRIGGNSLWGEFFDGLIDEVRVYNRALSQSEIQTDMNTPVG